MNDVLPFSISDVVFRKISDEPGIIIGVIYRGKPPNQVMLYKSHGRTTIPRIITLLNYKRKNPALIWLEPLMTNLY